MENRNIILLTKCEKETQILSLRININVIGRSKLFCQQMNSLLKHKMLQLTLKIYLYRAATCFGTFGPSSGSIRRNFAKVTVFV
jgi:hypothetical protein